MKTTARMAIAFVLGWATPLFADTGQGTTPSSTSSSSSDAPNMSTMTPEMWFYIQEWRRHDDPAQAVRRKAEFRAEQRRQRLAVRKWYGYSKIRPRATATPWTSSPRPRWRSHYYHANQWRGNLPPRVAIEQRPGSIWR